MTATRHQQRHKSTYTNLGLTIVSLGLSYAFFSLSVDKGNLFYYLLTLIFLVYFLKSCARLIRDLFHVIIK